jgi:N-acetylmuramoyl-L-alanine amidase
MSYQSEYIRTKHLEKIRFDYITKQIKKGVIIDAPLNINKWSRPRKQRKNIKAIVLHYTAANGLNKEWIKRYFDRLGETFGEERYASAHYAVDSHGVMRMIPDDELAYHCGAKEYKEGILEILHCNNPNDVTIGVEMCIETDGTFSRNTLMNTCWLVNYLRQLYDISMSMIFRHYDITGKMCPLPMVSNPRLWDIFRNYLEEL